MGYRDKYNTNRRMDHLPFAISSNLTSQTEFLGRVSGRAVVLGLGRRVVVRRVGRLVVTGGLILPITNTHFSKICLKRPLKKGPKVGFQERFSLNAGRNYCRMLSWSILQYSRPALSYHFSLKPLFCLFLSVCSRQVLLYSASYLR